MIAPHLLLGVLAGLALAAAHPPWDLPVAAFAVPALLVAGLDLARARGARAWTVPAVAAAAGFGAVLAWVIQPAGVVGWVLLVAVQVGWWVLFGAVVHALPPSWPVRPLVVAVAWVGIDALRGVLPLNGFDWGTLGAATVGLAWVAPLARLAGEKAITLMVVLLSVATWEAVRGPVEAARRPDGGIAWPRVRQTLPAGRVGTAWLAGGALVVTMATIGAPPSTGEADVVAVQPNGFDTWSGTGAELDVAIARNAVELTESAIADGGAADLVVWPESTIDADPRRVPALADALAAGGAATDGRLLAGAILDGPEPRTFLNELLVVDADGQVSDTYRKRRLVPFGEYVPFRSALDWVPPLRQVPRDAIAGEAPQVLDVDDLRVAAIICFETLFPGLLRSNLLAGDEPAGLVVAATNDASFGPWGAAEQHLAQSRLRALETGRWVVHAAISGTSAFVDPDGRVYDQTRLWETTSIRRTVTTTDGRTPFLVTGDWLGPATMLGLAVLALLGVARRRRDRTAAGGPADG